MTDARPVNPGIDLRKLPAPLAKKLLAFVEAEDELLDNGDGLLFGILHDDFYQVPPVEIAKLSIEAYNRRRRGEVISFRALLTEKSNTPPTTLFDLPLHEGLRSASATVDALVGELGNNPVNRNMVYSALTAASLSSLHEATPSGEERFASLQNPFTEYIPRILKPDESFTNALLSKFTLHVSALNNYLNCPLKFYFENLLHAPCTKSAAAQFGSAVHFALQALFEQMQQHPSNIFPGKEKMLIIFNAFMYQHILHFPPEKFETRRAYGEEILTRYYDQNIEYCNKIVAVERNIANVVVNGITIKGKIDKLEFNGKEVKIIDYKTGDPEKAYDRLQPPDEQSPNGGDYWRQAVFYKILVDNYPQKAWKVTEVAFHFIERDKTDVFQKIRIAVEKPDIETVTQQIVDVSRKIKEHNFYTGCGKGNCYWCSLVKENGMQAS